MVRQRSLSDNSSHLISREQTFAWQAKCNEVSFAVVCHEELEQIRNILFAFWICNSMKHRVGELDS